MPRLYRQAVFAVLATAYLAAATRIGPVIAVLTPTHGVHAGDLIPAAVFVVVAGMQSTARLAARS